MNLSLSSLSEKTSLEKTLIYILIFAVIATFLFLIYLFFVHFTKNIQLIEPAGAEEWEIGKTYTVSWKSRGIERVGIVLFRGIEPVWIEKNIFAALGQYQWKIQPGRPYGDDYWIAVFEYPWKKGNVIDYSDGAFAVVYSETANCDMLSLQNNWPYVPSDLPNFRRVFFTSQNYTGNLGELKGADEICQREAGEKGLDGNWTAFLGGDFDEDSAVSRLQKTPLGTRGIFAEASPASILIRGASCHRLLGNDFDDFLAKFSELSMINQRQLGTDFLGEFDNIWMGRLNETSRKNCGGITAALTDPFVPLAEKYTLTTTCQNWTTSSEFVGGYPVPAGTSKPQFPVCYTPQGRATDAVTLGGIATDLLGLGQEAKFTLASPKSCDTPQKLLCVEAGE